MREIFVATIDVEPGDRQLAPGERPEWSGFLDCCRLFERLRERLRLHTGRPVHFSWFLRMDPQVAAVYGSPGWVAERYGEALRALERAGDLIGLHVHAWQWRPEEDAWVAAHGDPRWVRRCVAFGAAAFGAARRRPLRAFRFGDRWLSNPTVAQLARLGVRYELTVEPGMREAPGMVPSERSTGALPDTREAPRRPYRPSLADYRRPGRWLRRRLWELPVSTGCVNGPALPARFEPQHDVVHLNLGLRPEWVRHLLDGLLAAPEPIVVSVARTGDAESPAGLASLVENLGYLAEHPAIAARVFATPPEAIALYRGRPGRAA